MSRITIAEIEAYLKAKADLNALEKSVKAEGERLTALAVAGATLPASWVFVETRSAGLRADTKALAASLLNVHPSEINEIARVRGFTTHVSPTFAFKRKF